MVSIKKSKSAASSQPLKQSLLLFASTKRSNSGQSSSVKGKKPPVRTESAPTTRQSSSKRSIVDSPSSDSSASSHEDEKVIRVKRREVVEEVGSGLEEKAVLQRPKLDYNDRKWSNIHNKARQKMGGIPPVHGSGQTKVNHILRVFDLSYEYGPCIGVTRLERWERAQALGLHPPPEVHDILVTEEGSEQTNLKECVFYNDV